MNETTYLHCKTGGCFGSTSESVKVTVSVIVPFYNAEKHFQETLDSIASQSFERFEVILVDDGSTDRSAQMAQQRAENDARFIYAWQENQGAGAARNLGMSLSRGDYLTFLDSDDLFEPSLLARLYAVAETSGADITICGADSFDSDTGETLEKLATSPIGAGVFGREEYETHLFQLFNPPPWNKLFTRRLAEEHELAFQNLRYSNDTYFVWAALAASERVAAISDCLVHYRIGHPVSLRANVAIDHYCDLLAFDALFEQLYAGTGETMQLISFRKQCAFITCVAAVILAAANETAAQMFIEECHSRCEPRWRLADLPYRSTVDKTTLWKFKRICSAKPNKILWTCRTRDASRTRDTNGTGVQKTRFTLRLLVASIFMRSDSQ